MTASRSTDPDDRPSRGGTARWLTRTSRCIQVNHAGGRFMNRWPAAVMISANSRSGPFIPFFREPFCRFGAAARVSESSGLRVALRCRSDRCR